MGCILCEEEDFMVYSRCSCFKKELGMLIQFGNSVPVAHSDVEHIKKSIEEIKLGAVKFIGLIINGEIKESFPLDESQIEKVKNFLKDLGFKEEKKLSYFAPQKNTQLIVKETRIFQGLLFKKNKEDVKIFIEEPLD